MDLTGKFPLRSVDGYTAIFIMHDWNSNSIQATPIKDANDETMVEVFKMNIEYLSKWGSKPEFNIMDNVASKAIRACLEEEKIDFQLIEPHNHRANACERAIQTCKNHFISGLCISEDKFLTILWSYLVKQAQYSLNKLRTSRIYQKLAAYHVLEGTHDFNQPVTHGPHQPQEEQYSTHQRQGHLGIPEQSMNGTFDLLGSITGASPSKCHPQEGSEFRDNITYIPSIAI